MLPTYFLPIPCFLFHPQPSATGQIHPLLDHTPLLAQNSRRQVGLGADQLCLRGLKAAGLLSKAVCLLLYVKLKDQSVFTALNYNYVVFLNHST